MRVRVSHRPPAGLLEWAAMARATATRASALACVEALVRAGEPAIAILAKGLCSLDGEIAVAAARALGRTGPAAEAPLVAALADERPAARVAAAESPGRAGSAESVPTPRDAASRSHAGGMGRAVRQAVAGIHARLSGAEPGSVSLVGDERAHGSISPDEVDAAGEATRPLQRPGTIQGKT
jgi:hypothetical protein